jgi:hypothetical protein
MTGLPVTVAARYLRGRRAVKVAASAPKRQVYWGSMKIS